ncbi:MAG: hypothetical protein ACRBBN_04710 [Methyloligellaceae bacterium]
MAAQIIRIKYFSILLSSAFLIFFTSLPTTAEAASICRVYNYKNSQPITKPIPHIQWRLCRIAGKKLYYLRTFYNCGNGNTCTDGWVRAIRRGRHYASTVNGQHIKRSIFFYLPTLNRLKMYIRADYLRHDNTKDWRLTFRRY